MLSLSNLILETEPLQSPQVDVELFTITYLSQGLRVKAMLAIPRGSGPFPALLYCRGGMRQIGRVRKERIAQLASFGYIVLAPHYRGNEGGEGRDEFGGEDRQDVYSAYDILKDMPLVIPERISLYGFSRGGIMAMLAAIEREGFYAAIVWSGVVDLLLTFEERQDMRRMLKRVVGHPEKQREAYLARSPIYRVDEVDCPVLIIHGTEDQNVGVEHARRLAQALEVHQKPYEIWLAEGASHLFDSMEIKEYTCRMFDWLDRSAGLLRK
ncbi:alpha/beta hydrolase family protein [Brevibacillus ginsengisoli]|uniref:alpha/beta hydrolase family protein n=1 Tax=Brevibacillus ginsengisoli TaxID=363854 RepID=UPI003CF41B91